MASANTAKEKAQDATENAKSAARDAAETAQEKVGDAASYAKDKVESGVKAVGDYLKDADLKGMGEDLTELIRKHPLLSVAVGVGIGMLVAGVTRR